MDRRTKFQQNLNPYYLDRYLRLCELLPARWQPYQGFRTFSQQQALYDQGRRTSGRIVTNASGGKSAHCYGCATDWTLWDPYGQPIWLEKDDPAWEEYVDAIHACGLRPGKEFGDIDHNELKVKVSWIPVYEAFLSAGMDAALALITSEQVLV